MSAECAAGSLEKAFAQLAQDWMYRGVWCPEFGRPLAVDLVVGGGAPEQRALLAAACDVVDLLTKSPEDRQALRDLGFQPVPEQVEGE